MKHMARLDSGRAELAPSVRVFHSRFGISELELSALANTIKGENFYFNLKFLDNSVKLV